MKRNTSGVDQTQPFLYVWLWTQGPYVVVLTLLTLIFGLIFGGDFAYKFALFFFIMALSMSLTHVAIQRSSLRNGSPVQRAAMYIFAFLVSIPLLIFLSGQLSAWCCIQEEVVEELAMMAKHATDILAKNNITYWVCGGSLLGAVREKNVPYQVLPWEHDFDLCIMEEDAPRATELWNQDPLLVPVPGHIYHSFSFSKLYLALVLSFSRVYIDVYLQYPNPNNLQVMNSNDGALAGKDIPLDLIFPLSKIKHLDLELNAPKDPVEVTRLTYGDSFMTPMYPPGLTGHCCRFYFDCSHRYSAQVL